MTDNKKPTKVEDDDDGDIWELFRIRKEMNAEKRRANTKSSAQLLEKEGIPFESKNNGAHLIIKFAMYHINFWPGTGKWHVLKPTTKEGRGVFPLIKWLEQRAWRTALSLERNPPPSPTGKNQIIHGPVIQNLPMNTPQVKKIRKAFLLDPKNTIK